MKTLLAILLLISTMSTEAQNKPPLKAITSGVYVWNNLPVKPGDKRVGRFIDEGTTAEFEYFEMHATTQEKGATPRPPHAQADREELIIVKEGSAKFTIDGKETILGAGSIVIIPPLAMQAIQNVGDGPLTYYVLIFKSKKPMDMERCNKAGGALLINADTLKYVPSERGGGIKYFNRPTAMTENYEMHITELKKKGPSHAPHAHVDTEIILLIEGDAELLADGNTYKGTAGDLFIMESNKLHGISNATDKPCKYFAFKWR
jgi:quercetin dioxygenase-like cupin family protein